MGDAVCLNLYIIKSVFIIIKVKNIIVYGASVNMLQGTVHYVLESVYTVEGSYAKDCF